MRPVLRPIAPPGKIKGHDVVKKAGNKVAPAATGGPNTHYTDEAYKLAYRQRARVSFLASGGFRNDRAGIAAGFRVFRNDQETIGLYST